MTPAISPSSERTGCSLMSEFTGTLTSPMGPLHLEATQRGLSALRFPHSTPGAEERIRNHPFITEAKQQLSAYFAGKLETFSVPLDWCGTAFEKSVWLALTAIPYGDTVTYADVARAIKRPSSARPVGGAVGKNPLPIIVPCHRVIGTDQTLTGFTSGLDIKIRLLQLEGWEVL